MTSNIHYLQHPANHYELSPEVIEKRLHWLIRHYLYSRSPAIAGAVVGLIERLCKHPDYAGDSRERCAYLRLRAHWHWLANPTGGGQSVRNHV